MKRDTLTHPKTADFASRLGISIPQALGHLALLWDFTATHAVAGNVGKFSDAAIARGSGWDETMPFSAEEFIGALADARWLDRSSEYRLLVHDWADHCERWVKMKAKKIGVQIIDTPLNSINAPILSELRSDPITRVSCQPQTNPSLSANGRRKRPAIEHADDAEERETREFLQLRDATPEEIDWIISERGNLKIADKPALYLLRVIETRRKQKLGKPPPENGIPDDIPNAENQPGYAKFLERQMRVSANEHPP